MRASRRIAVLFALAFFAVVGFSGVAQAQSYEPEELRFLDLINAYRAENGLEPLSLSAPLSVASERHSEDMGTYGFFSHTTQASSYYPVGADHSTRIAQEGYDYNTYTAENLAYGQSTAEEVFETWRASAGHNANMLGDYSVIGIGLVWVDGTPYWTTVFGAHADPSATTAAPQGGGASPEPAPRADETPVALRNPAPDSVTEGDTATTEQYEGVNDPAADAAARDQYAAEEQYATETGAREPDGPVAAAATQYENDGTEPSPGLAGQQTAARSDAIEPDDTPTPGDEAQSGEQAGSPEEKSPRVAGSTTGEEDSSGTGKVSEILASQGMTTLPDTGGAPLAVLGAGLLLAGGGLLARRVLR